jgi:hypothetical protein
MKTDQRECKKESGAARVFHMVKRRLLGPRALADNKAAGQKISEQVIDSAHFVEWRS